MYSVLLQSCRAGVSCCTAAGPVCLDIIHNIHNIPEMNHQWQCLTCSCFKEQPAVVSISRPLIEQRHSALLAYSESSQMCPCFICADAYIGMSLESDVVRKTYLLQHFHELLVKVHDQKASLSFVLEQQAVTKGWGKVALQAVVALSMRGLHKLVKSSMQGLILLPGFCRFWHRWQHMHNFLQVMLC